MTPNPDRASKRWVARKFKTRETNVTPMTDAGDIPFLRVEAYVKGDGTPGRRYVYSKAGVVAFLRRKGEIAAEQSGGAA